MLTLRAIQRAELAADHSIPLRYLWHRQDVRDKLTAELASEAKSTNKSHQYTMVDYPTYIPHPLPSNSTPTLPHHHAARWPLPHPRLRPIIDFLPSRCSTQVPQKRHTCSTRLRPHGFQCLREMAAYQTYPLHFLHRHPWHRQPLALLGSVLYLSPSLSSTCMSLTHYSTLAHIWYAPTKSRKR
ncbi:hypothetical protein BDU57DRAFT_299292 [Ampelomyces quisqualis]|uniref:Uncharacterized protein n=1 Tax=Ampelomyces quisqualis TaxID=50730 RepID=A0A6A5QGJ2_AMPQU|nr:hypothetical protein BDU57DRAFT_299292 [Ampelomyces quisqualis]